MKTRTPTGHDVRSFPETDLDDTTGDRGLRRATMTEGQAAAAEVAAIITEGRDRRRAATEILDELWDAAGRWAADDPLASAPADIVDEARAFMADATWTYARTMPDNPHWYVVRTKLDDPKVDALDELLRNHSRLRRWHGHPYRAVDLDGWSVWDIWPVINRKPTRFARWDGEPSPPQDWLPDHQRRDLGGREVIGIQ
jgi:hypothetical protein